jgi:hypothetical protein
MWVECLALLRKIEANRKPIVSVSEVKKTTNKELVNYGIWLHLSIMTVNNLSVVDYIFIGGWVFCFLYEASNSKLECQGS